MAGNGLAALFWVQFRDAPNLKHPSLASRVERSMIYFFNLAGAIYDSDVKGVELPSLGAARLPAAQHAGELLRDRPGLVWAGEELRLEVTNSDQLVLFTLIVMGVDAPALRRG